VKRALAIAANEVQRLVRSRVALTGLLMVLLLTVAAAIASSAYYRDQSALRERMEAQANADFTQQPDRHPHRVVHFGHFAMRPPSGLAAMDPGVEPFTGVMVYLEGHRQNSANFGDARQSSLLVRFGQLSPAFVLQAVAPLLLIFLGAGMVARERERGTLRQMMLAGASGGDLMIGKMLALGAAAAVMTTPAVLLVGNLGLNGQVAAITGGMMLMGYGAYLVFWVVLTVLVSALTPSARPALVLLTALWALSVVVAPRVAAEAGAGLTQLATRLENDVAIQRDLRDMGDSHDPDDPYFDAFKRATLKQYGVARVEDLPVNYRGLLGIEGERMTASLFNRYAAQNFAAMADQSRTMDLVAAISPTVALRRLSMTTAGTDLATYRRFIDEAERYRYELVQRLNRMQAESVTFKDDAAKSNDAAAEARSRVSADNWRATPAFRFPQEPAAETAARATPSLVVILVWLALAAGFASLAASRLQRVAR
jgi:ABC-2 type transport system permease protein